MSPKLRAIGRKFIPRTNDHLRANPLYRWGNRLLWVVIGFFLFVALLIKNFGAGV